jgi:hypothetical protein
MARRCSCGGEHNGCHATDEHPAVSVVGAKKPINTQWLFREAITHEGEQFNIK